VTDFTREKKNKDSRDLPSSKSTLGSLSAHHHHQTFMASTTGIHWGDSLTESSWSDGQGPILQAYPFCENSTPEKKKIRLIESY
jgi:hypothetical protein